MFGKSDRDDVSSDASPTQKKPRHAAAVASTRINTPSSAKTNKAPPSHKKPSTPASAPAPPVVNADSLKKLLGRAAPKKIPLTPSSIFNHELLSGLMNSNGDEAKNEEAKRDEGYSCYISKKTNSTKIASLIAQLHTPQRSSCKSEIKIICHTMEAGACS